jgi:hypothetical protein
MRNKRAIIAFILELLVFAAIVMIAEAAGFLDSVASIGLFVGFWAGPLFLAAVHLLVFCRSAHALSMPYVFVIGTLAIVAALSGSVLMVLAGHLASGIPSVAVLLVLGFVIARRTPRLPELAIGESELGQTLSSFPAAPGSKYKTIPMLEMILGLGSILLAQVTPVSKGLELWAYLPLALWVGLGAVFQIYHIRSHAARSRAISSNRL